MKTIIIAAAAALGFAAPAAAQPAQPLETHQQHGHGQHQGHGSSAPDPKGQDHDQHGKCCGDANGDGRMDCCEGDQAAQRPCCAKHAEHAKHTAPAQPQKR